MAQKHFFPMSSIMVFFKGEEKLVKRGENAVESNHVKSMMFDANFGIIRGEVQASMRNRTYKIEIFINSDKSIKEASCDCPRGQLICHHMAALAIFGHQNIATTDVVCTWNARKMLEEEVPTMEKLYPSKPFQAIKTEIPENKFETFKETINSFGNAVGFSWLLRKEPEETPFSIVSIEDIVFSDKYVTAVNKLLYLEEALKVTQNTIHEIAAETTGQSSNKNWLIARKHRLTASKFGAVLNAVRRQKYPVSLFRQLTEYYNLDRVRAIKWGRENESVAKHEFEQATGKSVQETGLWLHPCGYLGASPDGLIEEENSIVEIKCPYKYRENNILEKLKEDDYIIKINDEENIEINKSHEIYHQIQGTLHITQRDKCYLIVWTPVKTLVNEIGIDKEWSNNIELLKQFYLTKYVNYITTENI